MFLLSHLRLKFYFLNIFKKPSSFKKRVFRFHRIGIRSPIYHWGDSIIREQQTIQKNHNKALK